MLRFSTVSRRLSLVLGVLVCAAVPAMADPVG